MLRKIYIYVLLFSYYSLFIATSFSSEVSDRTLCELSLLPFQEIRSVSQPTEQTSNSGELVQIFNPSLVRLPDFYQFCIAHLDLFEEAGAIQKLEAPADINIFTNLVKTIKFLGSQFDAPFLTILKDESIPARRATLVVNYAKFCFIGLSSHLHRSKFPEHPPLFPANLGGNLRIDFLSFKTFLIEAALEIEQLYAQLFTMYALSSANGRVGPDYSDQAGADNLERAFRRYVSCIEVPLLPEQDNSEPGIWPLTSVTGPIQSFHPHGDDKEIIASPYTPYFSTVLATLPPFQHLCVDKLSFLTPYIAEEHLSAATSFFEFQFTPHFIPLFDRTYSPQLKDNLLRHYSMFYFIGIINYLRPQLTNSNFLPLFPAKPLTHLEIKDNIGFALFLTQNKPLASLYEKIINRLSPGAIKWDFIKSIAYYNRIRALNKGFTKNLNLRKQAERKVSASHNSYEPISEPPVVLERAAPESSLFSHSSPEITPPHSNSPSFAQGEAHNSSQFFDTFHRSDYDVLPSPGFSSSADNKPLEAGTFMEEAAEITASIKRPIKRKSASLSLPGPRSYQRPRLEEHEASSPPFLSNPQNGDYVPIAADSLPPQADQRAPVSSALLHTYSPTIQEVAASAGASQYARPLTLFTPQSTDPSQLTPQRLFQELWSTLLGRRVQQLKDILKIKGMNNLTYTQYLEHLYGEDSFKYLDPKQQEHIIHQGQDCFAKEASVHLHIFDKIVKECLEDAKSHLKLGLWRGLSYQEYTDEIMSNEYFKQLNEVTRNHILLNISLDFLSNAKSHIMTSINLKLAYYYHPSPRVRERHYYGCVGEWFSSYFNALVDKYKL